MFKRTSLISMIALASLFNLGYTLTGENAQEISLTQHISNQYLISTFGAANQTPVTPAIDPNAGFLEKFKQQIDSKKQLLTPREIQEVAFNMVTSSHNFETNIIDSSCIDKLEIVGGGENSQQHLLGNVFKNINTAVGKAHAALAFCHPTTDTMILHKRQQAITYLSRNEHALQQADRTLKAISILEGKSSIFWHAKPAVNPEMIKFSYFGQQFDIANALKQFNTNTIALELTNRTYSIGQIAMGTVYLPLCIIYALHQQAQAMGIPFNELKNAMMTKINALPAAFKAGFMIPVTVQGFMAYSMGMTLKNSQEMYSHLQDILIATSSHVQELKKLSSLIDQNKELLTLLPSLQPLADFNNSTKHSAKLNKLMGMLNTNTFKGEASFFSIAGRVLAAYELMKQVKDELAPAFAAAGELDMYIALAQLYSSHEGKLARYCMVNFVENSAIPMIDAHNFWNPFINPDTVVVNNATFDASCPNSILTGPNTGGKSTVIKAIMLNVLMGQTFGIAPSESLTLTPFTQLNCFMNISDDIATGASLFKSEVMRAKKLLDIVQSLKANEFSFVIIDEVFTGTSPKEGEIAAMRFAKHLGTYKNNVGIIATHYPKMVDLETETNGNYRNHHVEILRNEDDSLNRTFKLKNGPSFFNVASDILEEEGLFI